jgi:GNAT superfamily N-acetyltransferase
MSRRVQCRDCEAEVLKVNTTKGKTNLLDPEADPELASFVLFERRGHDVGESLEVAVKLHERALERAKRLGVPLHTSHFDTCPNRRPRT